RPERASPLDRGLARRWNARVGNGIRPADDETRRPSARHRKGDRSRSRGPAHRYWRRAPKRYGFPQAVIDGVVGHHGDVEPVTMVGTLISAADAISAARPGA